jgi:hypothetical protein
VRSLKVVKYHNTDFVWWSTYRCHIMNSKTKWLAKKCRNLCLLSLLHHIHHYMVYGVLKNSSSDVHMHIYIYFFFFYSRNRYSSDTKTGTFLNLYSVTLHCLFSVITSVVHTLPPIFRWFYQSTILELCVLLVEPHHHHGLDFIVWQKVMSS